MSEPDGQRAWADAKVGALIEGPSMTLDWTAMALQVSGSQDLNQVHHDPDYARASGHQSVFFNTGWTAAMLARVVTDWVGPQGWLRRLEFQMRRMNTLGDTVTAKAKVRRTSVDDDGCPVTDLDVWLESKRHGVTTTGTAVVTALPLWQASAPRSVGDR
jgi:acyl dehydratase